MNLLHCGIHIFFLCVCINLICAFSDYSTKNSNQATNKNNIRINPEELLRRQKIANAFKSTRAETQKDWIETYSHNFGSHKIHKSKMNSKESSSIYNNMSPSNKKSKAIEEEVLDSAAASTEANEKISNELFSQNNNQQPNLNDDVEPFKATGENELEISVATEKEVGITLKDLNSGEKNEGKITVNDVTQSETYKKTEDLLESSGLYETIIQDEKYHNLETVTYSPSEDFDSKEDTEVRNVKNELSGSNSPEDFMETQKILYQPSHEYDLETGDDLNKQKLTAHSEMLKKRRKIADSYISKHVENQKNWVEPHWFNFGSAKIKDSDTNSEFFEKNKLNENIKYLLVDDMRKFYENHFLSNSEAISEDDISKKSPISEDTLVQRREIVKSFLSEYGKYSKTDDWVETYNRNFKVKLKKKSLKHKSSPTSHFEKSNVSINGTKETNNSFSEPSKEIGDVFVIECTQLTAYFNRWIQKFLKKIENAEHKSITFSFNSEFVNSLKELSLSENFDIVTADEVISQFISNATIYNNFNWIAFIPFFSAISNRIYSINSIEFIPSSDTMIISCVIVIISMLSIYCFMKKRFFLLLLVIIVLGIMQHAYKQHQIVMARKHTILSRIVPSHCVASSTFLGRVWDFFAMSFYEEECNKYYEAVMVDSLGDTNILLVIVDLISSIFLQMFYPLSRVLNHFVKESFSNTTFIQKGIILILIFGAVFFIFAFYFKYKFRLPFFLGSAEPTYAPLGSHAEDLTLFQNRSLQRLFFRSSSASANSIYVYERDIKEVDVDRKHTLTMKVNSACCKQTLLPDAQCSCKDNACLESSHITTVEDITPYKQRQKACSDINDLKKKIIFDKPERCFSHSPVKAEEKQICNIKSSPVKEIYKCCCGTELNSQDCCKSAECLHSSPKHNSEKCKMDQMKLLTSLDLECESDPDDVKNENSQCFKITEECPLQSEIQANAKETCDEKNSPTEVISENCPDIAYLEQDISS